MKTRTVVQQRWQLTGAINYSPGAEIRRTAKDCINQADFLSVAPPSGASGGTSWSLLGLRSSEASRKKQGSEFRVGCDVRRSKKKESGRRQTSWTRLLAVPAAPAVPACQHPRGGQRRSKELKVTSCICLRGGKESLEVISTLAPSSEDGSTTGSALTPATSAQTRLAVTCSGAIGRYVGREHLVAIPGYGSPGLSARASRHKPWAA